MLEWQISNATLLNPGLESHGHGLVISQGQIQTILKSRESDADLLNLNLHGMLVLPGLINGHDSLLASYHAYEGPGAPYRNWLAYDNDLKASELFKERAGLPVSALYQLGAYRNLFGGTTTINDHIPHFVREPYQNGLPIDLLTNFGIAHSVCSYSLDWGNGIHREYEYAVDNNLPFILHIAEGMDPESQISLQKLDEAGALGEHTVLVHGIGLSEKDLDLIATRDAHIVWCPSANLRLYHKTLPVEAALQRGINLVLGTDSAMSGSTNLLTELNLARDYYLETYQQHLSAEFLLALVTSNAARAFRLSDRGELKSAQKADLVVLQNLPGFSPDQVLPQLDANSVFLVVRDGLPVYGDASLEPIFVEQGILTERIQVGGQTRLVQTGLRQVLDDILDSSRSRREFAFLPMENQFPEQV